MTKDEALKLALEYLEASDNYLGSLDHSKPIAAIREALAQPEHDWKAEYIKQVELHNQTLDELRDALAQQEPVIDKSAAVRIATALGWEPKRKPLTDEQINEIADEFIVNYRIPAGSHYDFVRAIEAAHGIKE